MVASTFTDIAAEAECVSLAEIENLVRKANMELFEGRLDISITPPNLRIMLNDNPSSTILPRIELFQSLNVCTVAFTGRDCDEIFLHKLLNKLNEINARANSTDNPLILKYWPEQIPFEQHTVTVKIAMNSPNEQDILDMLKAWQLVLPEMKIRVKKAHNKTEGGNARPVTKTLMPHLVGNGTQPLSPLSANQEWAIVSSKMFPGDAVSEIEFTRLSLRERFRIVPTIEQMAPVAS